MEDCSCEEDGEPGSRRPRWTWSFSSGAFSATAGAKSDDSLLSQLGFIPLNDSGVPDVTLFVAFDDPTTLGTVEGLQFPDNIAIDRRGNVWIHEDIRDGD